MGTQGRQHLGQAAVLAWRTAHGGGGSRANRVSREGQRAKPNGRGVRRSTSQGVCHKGVRGSSTDQGTLGAAARRMAVYDAPEAREGTAAMADGTSADLATVLTALQAEVS